MAKNKIEKIQKAYTLKDVLDVIGGKWSMPIIYNLSKGKMRFKEIERTIAGINTRMLVKELKNKLKDENAIKASMHEMGEKSNIEEEESPV